MPPKHTGDGFWHGSETRHPTYVDCTKQQTIFVEQIFFTRLFFPVCEYRNQYLYFSPTKKLVLSLSCKYVTSHNSDVMICTYQYIDTMIMVSILIAGPGTNADLAEQLPSTLALDTDR